jgi:hypothetical protein
MKFKCGPSEEELDKRNALFRAKVKIMENWHDHFAWWPVKMGTADCRWLETVQRRYYVWHSDLGGIRPQYREKQHD